SPPSCCSRPSAADGPFELGLGHLRPARDVPLLGLVVELLLGAAAGAAVGAQPAAPARGNVLGGGAAGLFRLAGPGPLLVHGAGGDLFGRVLAVASLPQAFLDVFVLPFPLRVPCLLRHRRPPGYVDHPSLMLLPSRRL